MDLGFSFLVVQAKSTSNTILLSNRISTCAKLNFSITFPEIIRNNTMFSNRKIMVRIKVKLTMRCDYIICTQNTADEITDNI